MSVENKKLKIFQSLEEDLLSLLDSTFDYLELARELLEYRIVSRLWWDKLASIDRDHIALEIMVRYLLQHIGERVEEDQKVYGRLVRVLSRLGGGVRDVCEGMRRELHSIEGGMDSDRGVGGEGKSGIILVENDIPLLVEVLASASHKWEEIGIALDLPKHVRVDCQHAMGNILRLQNILTVWIKNSYYGYKSATLDGLREALDSEVVGLNHVSNSLLTFKELTDPLPLLKKPRFRFSVGAIAYQSSHQEVCEGKSTLLEVQVSCNGYTSFQWSKDGHILPDGTDFSGVSSNILYIHNACQSTEGTYSCTVSNGSQTVCSAGISLTVLCPPGTMPLLNVYSSMGEVPKDSWPPVCNSTFINPVLVKQKPTDKCDYHTVCGDMDDILESKEVVKYKEVFSKYRKGSLIQVIGRPGTGKTTLIHKLAKDWSKGHCLRGTMIVFPICLGMLDFTRRDESLSDLFQIFYDGDLSLQVAHDLQKREGKGVCFIIDGLDEYENRNMKKSVIFQLIYKTCLPLSMVIVSSRHTETIKLRNACMKCNEQIEVFGFTKEQIYRYIDSYNFDSLSTVNLLKAFLSLHPNVLHMCYLPVHAAMICFMFNQWQDMPNTETQIYECFTQFTLQRNCRKQSEKFRSLTTWKDLSEKGKQDFLMICKLAYNMSINSQRVLSQKATQNSLSSESALGLVTVEQSLPDLEKVYSFHHLTFQEYLAAYHLASLDKEEQYCAIAMHASIRNQLKNPLKNLWKFYCGIISKNSKDPFVLDSRCPQNLLISKENLSLHQVQCAFESQHVELCDSLVKGSIFSVHFEFITALDFAALGYVLSKATKRVSKLSFVGCTWDHDAAMAFTSYISFDQLHSIKELQISLSGSYELYKALNCLLSQLPFLEELDILNGSLSSLNIKYLTRNIALTQLKVLRIRLPLSPCSDPERILQQLMFGSKNIRQVFILIDPNKSCKSYNCALWKKILCYAFDFQVFVDSDISWVYLYNSDSFSSLRPERFSYCTEVVLVNCGIDDEGAELLARRLNTSMLENLVVDFNRICDSGAVALASCMSRCSVLQEISIQCNSIGDSGATALASALVSCSSLRRLDLQGNDVSDEGAVAIAKAAEDLPHLDLYLHNVNITEEGVEKVLELRSRTKIGTMEFSSSWEAINDASIDGLRNALKCGTLPMLKISGTNYGKMKVLYHELKNLRGIRGLDCDSIDNDILPTLCHILKLTTNLQVLKIDFVGDITDRNTECLRETLIACRHLQCICFHCATSKSIHSALLDILKKCVSIKSLIINDCHLGLESMKLLFYHSHLFNLRTLHLCGNDINSEGMDIICEVCITNLCYLDLSNNNLGDSGCIRLAEGLHDHTSLLGLKLGGNKITSDGVAALIPVIRNNHLQELDLSECRIGSEGVATLMEVIYADTLQTLDLSCTGICVEGTIALSAGLKNCKSLVKLDISYNNIGSHCMSSLVDSLQCCTNLQVFNLGYNNISDGAASIVDIINACKYLQVLDCMGNTISVDDAIDMVSSWKHKSCFSLYWSPVEPHRSALQEGKGCCSSCDHLLEVYNDNDYVIILDIPKSVPRIIRLSGKYTKLLD